MSLLLFLLLSSPRQPGVRAGPASPSGNFRFFMGKDQAGGRMVEREKEIKRGQTGIKGNRKRVKRKESTRARGRKRKITTRKKGKAHLPTSLET
ncbi:hypothetical protein AOQ84DRAFT_59238 [Glonium stellatum]|uniref:Secreted protein n=1 Tax=Glonium stellatum TaxID=574774 RepID=A0A8E2EZC1_9PEZI|nr:hypothetical protein AOQ84DRAFT_59238 [Glonium stellatum]